MEVSGMHMVTTPAGVDVNDTHSKLNPSRVREVQQPHSLESLCEIVSSAAIMGAQISIAGARHAMGGQQFGADTVLCDTRGLNKLIHFHEARGVAEIEAGATWPEVVQALHASQPGIAQPWTIIQKQTGADQLTLGGAVGANIHGRGLTMKPFVDNIEALSLVNAQGELLRCSRTENRELFQLVIGGYGLFGVVYSVSLRLARRKKMRRVVEITTTDTIVAQFADRVQAGFTFGDFQFATDERSPDFLHRGVFACYEEVAMDTPIPCGQQELSSQQWQALIGLAHTDKAQAYERYAGHYLSTNNQVYWSDSMQMSTYITDYHKTLDLQSGKCGSEMITELYVPRNSLSDFMRKCTADFRRNGANLIYGTIRLIERDDETFLPWAREPWACIVFNLHVDHTPIGILQAADAFRQLIDRALEFGGTYYLTYHRFATLDQVRAGYPRIAEFLRQKLVQDPAELFTSDWYRHFRVLDFPLASPDHRRNTIF